jgi:hypothetical protein
MCVSWVWAVDNSCQAGPLLFFDPQLPVPAGPEGRHRRLRRRHPTRTAKRWLSLLRRWGKKSETGSTTQAGRKPDAELFPDHPSRTISLCHRDVGTNRGGRRCDREVGSPGSASTGKLSRGCGGWQCTAWRAFVIGLRGPVRRRRLYSRTRRSSTSRRSPVALRPRPIRGVGKIFSYGEVSKSRGLTSRRSAIAGASTAS